MGEERGQTVGHRGTQRPQVGWEERGPGCFAHGGSNVLKAATSLRVSSSRQRQAAANFEVFP